MSDGTRVARQAGRQAGRLLFLGTGRVVHLDPASEAMFGWSCAEASGQPISALLPGLRWDGAEPGERCSNPQLTCEVEGLRKGGARFPAECAITACRLGDEVALLAVVRDRLADRRECADDAHADRLLALGTLAAGIGSEMADPITYVISNLEFMKGTMDGVADAARSLSGADPPQGNDAALLAARLAALVTGLDEALGEARHGASRVRDIAQRLRSFAHLEERRDLVQVSLALDAAIDLAWNEIGPRARLMRRYAQVPPVAASERRLLHVFLNLLLNAAQAVGEGSPDSNEIRVELSCDGPRVAVEIADTGAGIAPEHLSRVFEPFFTTRPAGQGMGLGLSVARGIVNDHGGRIALRSEPGKGSVFRVELPAAEATSP